jgi:hypothetical protein
MSATTTAARTMGVIQQCVNTLHDLAALSPRDAAEALAALRALDTPAAQAIGYIVAEVAEARHGAGALRRAQGQVR